MKELKYKIGRWAVIGSTAVASKLALAESWEDYDDEGLANQIRLGNASPTTLAVSVINWILGILALVAVVMILIGGFKWMTAGGNEEKVESAKKLLIAAIIGLVIILAAWGISVYAINNLLNFTT